MLRQRTIPTCHPDRPHGGRGLCRPCYDAAYYAAHRPAILARHVAYQATNRDARNAYGAQYRAAHREELHAYWRAYDARRRDARVAIRRAFYAAHRDRLLAQKRAYYWLHPEKRYAWHAAHLECGREVTRRRAAQKRRTATARIDVAALYARDRGVCHICGKSVSFAAMSLDHVVPLARGGAHTFENVRCAHRRCNVQRQHRGPGQPYLL